MLVLELQHTLDCQRFAKAPDEKQNIGFCFQGVLKSAWKMLGESNIYRTIKKRKCVIVRSYLLSMDHEFFPIWKIKNSLTILSRNEIPRTFCITCPTAAPRAPAWSAAVSCPCTTSAGGGWSSSSGQGTWTTRSRPRKRCWKRKIINCWINHFGAHEANDCEKGGAVFRHRFSLNGTITVGQSLD